MKATRKFFRGFLRLCTKSVRDCFASLAMTLLCHSERSEESHLGDKQARDALSSAVARGRPVAYGIPSVPSLLASLSMTVTTRHCEAAGRGNLRLLVQDRFFRQERGSVLVYVTLMMVVLLAFGAGVADAGMLYENRRQLQNGADGASLAGVQELLRFDLSPADRSALAINVALDYAQRNGVSAAEMESGYPEVFCVPFPYNNNCESGNKFYYNAVRVADNRNLSLMVAGLLNASVGKVGAVATAIINPVIPTEGLWPWGISQCNDWDGDGVIEPSAGECEIPKGIPVKLKLSAPPGAPGNFMPLDYPPGGGGANTYEGDIMYGYGSQSGDYVKPGLPWCGTTLSPCSVVDNPYVQTETGNVIGKTRSAVDYLVSMAASSGQDIYDGPGDPCTWDNAPKAPNELPPPWASGGASPIPNNWVGNASLCYRVGIVPILSWNSFQAVSGKKPVDIIAWGAFYLIGRTTGPGGSLEVWGYYDEIAKVSGGKFSDQVTGLWAGRLWE